MNCQKAKQIDIISFLNKYGYVPQKTNDLVSWYLSPFRKEKTPSFKVNSKDNIWFDFGEGIGGNIIDLVVKLENCDVKCALEKLSNNSFSFHQQTKFEESESEYLIKKIIDITNENLINYISSRKMNVEIAKKICFQVHYTFKSMKQNEYYGIGFMNDSGGIEIRSKYFKGCLGKKDITSINNNSNSVLIFESWSDFVSYMTLKNKTLKQENYIILNSTSLTKRAGVLLQNYKHVSLFLDNDEAGDKATKSIINSLSVDVIDCRNLYENYKDLNDYLINNLNSFVHSQSWL